MTNFSSSFSGSIPKMYDEILGPVYFEPFAIETAKRTAVFYPKKILEVACGTGIATNQLHKYLPQEVQITASDISEDMLVIAKEKLSSVKNISFQQADATALPFQNEKFDLVICQFGAMFFQDKQKTFSEMHRVLKPKGKFIFSTWDKLENNPLAGAGRKILMEYFDGHPPASLKTAFSMNEKEEILSLVASASFSCLNYENVQLPCIAPSAELLALAQVDGSLISNFIREKNPDDLPVLRNKIAKAITEKFGNPAESTMQAIIVTAEKRH